MTTKPVILTRTKILAFGLALYAAGLFTPIYQIAETVWGKEGAAQIFDWILYSKEAQEQIEATPPSQNPESPYNPANQAPKPEPVIDAIDITKITQHGRNRVDYSRMIVHPLLKSASVRGSNIQYNNDLPSNWWASSTDHMKFVRMHIVWQDGAGYYGGHFDWCRPGQKDKTLHNTKNGYMGKNSNGPFWFFMVSNDGKHRTNIVRVN